MSNFFKILIVLIVVAFGRIFAGSFFLSPQHTQPFIGSDGEKLQNSIAEIRTVDINGVKQRLLVLGRNIGNPVLLHLYGVQGGGDQTIVRSSEKTVEDIFTVVYWDQRGAGASYSSSTSHQSLSLSQIVGLRH